MPKLAVDSLIHMTQGEKPVEEANALQAPKPLAGHGVGVALHVPPESDSANPAADIKSNRPTPAAIFFIPLTSLERNLDPPIISL